MEFFDCNVTAGQGFVPPSLFSNWNPGSLLKELRRCGVTRALCRHRACLDIHPSHGNAALVELCAQYPAFKPAYVVMPGHTGEVPNGPALTKGAAAVWLFPRALGHRLDPHSCDELFAVIAAAGLPVFVDMRELSFDDVDDLAARYPAQPVVMTHLYYRGFRQLYPLLHSRGNLYVETSFLKNFRGLEDICARFGAARLLFGSGAPCFDPGAAVGLVLGAGLSDADKRRIAAGNLEALCGGEGR